MGLWYIRSYLVDKDKVDEHEQIVKKLRKKVQFQYFMKRFSPPTARVVIGKYKDMVDYENWRKKMQSDKEFWTLMQEWISCIEVNSLVQDYLEESLEE